jgi:hypothetical protein
LPAQKFIFIYDWREINTLSQLEDPEDTGIN